MYNLFYTAGNLREIECIIIIFLKKSKSKSKLLAPPLFYSLIEKDVRERAIAHYPGFDFLFSFFVFWLISL